MTHRTLPKPEFVGPRLKIERAKEHINNLHIEILAFAASDPHILRVQKNLETGDDLIELESAKALPDMLALIIGDALHNLRSALDLAINEVIFRRLGYYDDHAKLPFKGTRNALVGAINGALIKKASEKVCDYIVDVIKPYDGGDDTVQALHALDILDKHRLLLPVMHVNAINGIRYKDDTGKEAMIETWVISRNRKAVYKCVGQRNIQITDNGKASLAVFFERGLPMEGQSIVPTLIQFTELVSGTVEGIEDVFFAEK